MQPKSEADAPLGELLTQLSAQTSRLVRDEMRLAQKEFTESAKHAGAGAGLLSGAGIAALFGLAGYVFTKARYPMLPILLGVILGPLLERAIRRSLIISQGDVGIFFSSAISVVVFGAAIVLFVYGVIWPAVKSAMGKRAQEA